MRPEVQLCAYRLLDGEIHELALKESSRAAVDEYVRKLEAAMMKLTAGGAIPREPLLFLVDVRQSGLPPMVYFSRQAQRLFTHMPRRYQTRVALLHRPGLMVSLVQSFVALLPSSGDAMRFFSDEQREEAIQWLLERD